MASSRSDLTFTSGGQACRAWWYPGAAANGAAIVMAHGLGGLRSAGLEPYALRFAAAGFSVLLSDYRHFGASEGQPRQLVSVRRQLQDWAAAVACARSQPGIDAERVALWGSSFSGGHVAVAAARDPRVAALCAQGPMMDGLAASLNIGRYAGIGRMGHCAANRRALRMPPAADGPLRPVCRPRLRAWCGDTAGLSPAPAGRAAGSRRSRAGHDARGLSAFSALGPSCCPRPDPPAAAP